METYSHTINTKDLILTDEEKKMLQHIRINKPFDFKLIPEIFKGWRATTSTTVFDSLYVSQNAFIGVNFYEKNFTIRVWKGNGSVSQFKYPLESNFKLSDFKPIIAEINRHSFVVREGLQIHFEFTNYGKQFFELL